MLRQHVRIAWGYFQQNTEHKKRKKKKNFEGQGNYYLRLWDEVVQETAFPTAIFLIMTSQKYIVRINKIILTSGRRRMIDYIAYSLIWIRYKEKKKKAEKRRKTWEIQKENERDFITWLSWEQNHLNKMTALASISLFSLIRWKIIANEISTCTVKERK